MNLFELFRKNSKIITEGGNLSSQSPGWQGSADTEAEEIDLKIHDRDFMVGKIRDLLKSQNESFKAMYGKYIWNPDLLKSGQMFSGSSLHFFDIENINTQDFLNKLKKVTVGDIDTQVNQHIREELKDWLSMSIGKKIGNGTFLGFNPSLSSIWQLDDPPVRIQIDYETGPYDPETDRPTEWFAYSHSSHYDDMAAGIKGVFHKYINRALTHAQSSEKYVAKVLKKSVKISDEPVTSSDYSFAVSSAQGGGMSKKYKPLINPSTGEPTTKDGIPVMQEVPPKDREYIQNLDKQFKIIFGKNRSASDKNLQGSFVGTIKLMNKMFTPEQNEIVANSFLKILFGPGEQMITKDDPVRDRDIKFAAVDAMLLGGNGITPLNIPNASGLRQQAVKMAMEYADAYNAKKTGKSLDTEVAEDASAEQVAKPSYARQGIKHLYNRLPNGKISSMEMSNSEFQQIAKEISDNDGKLDGMTINLKIDGAGIRFGKDSSGRPFMMTSKVTTPLYSSDVGYFTSYGQEKGQSLEVLSRTKNYDQALSIITGSKFIQELPNNTIVQAEMLFNPMAEKTDQGLKFVNIEYDPKKLGKIMTLVPFSVKEFSTGEELLASEKVIKKLTSASDKNIKIITNKLDQKGIDVKNIIDPILTLDPKKVDSRPLFDKAKQELSTAIIDSPKLQGKDVLGNNFEGIVVNMPSGKMFKITSQLMKSAMSNKTTEPRKSQGHKTAVVAIGSFVGHIGHEQLWNHTLNKAKKIGGDPYLFIGSAVGKNDPIPPSVKVHTWQKLYPEYVNNISTVTHQGGTLIQKIKHELINPQPGKPPRYDNIILMVGEDQSKMNVASALMKSVNKFPGYEHVVVTLEPTPRDTGVSFTQLRNVLQDPDATPEQQYATWSKGFDEKKLGKDWIMYLMNITRKGMGINQSPLTESQTSSITEAPQLSSTISAIIADITGGALHQVYENLKSMADKYVQKHGELNGGYNLSASGITRRWYDSFYFNKLGSELQHLVRYAPRHTAELKEYLRDNLHPIKFTTIEARLPDILKDIGSKLNNKDLVRACQSWMKDRDNFYVYLKTLEHNDDDAPIKSIPKKGSNDLKGVQNTQVEKIVNDVLNKLPRSIAGDIRNAISRAPNKLQALQLELTRRKIQMEGKFPKSMFTGSDKNKLGPAGHAKGKQKGPVKQGQLVGSTEESIENEHIVKVKGGYELKSKHSDKKLGKYPTRAEAEKRERQVQYFKHAGNEVDEEKKKGADGKACWKGYRYAGTTNGKDKCVPVSESVEKIIGTLIERIIKNETI